MWEPREKCQLFYLHDQILPLCEVCIGPIGPSGALKIPKGWMAKEIVNREQSAHLLETQIKFTSNKFKTEKKITFFHPHINTLWNPLLQ